MQFLNHPILAKCAREHLTRPEDGHESKACHLYRIRFSEEKKMTNKLRHCSQKKNS